MAHYGEAAVESCKVWGVNLFISSTEIIDGTARFQAHSYNPEQVLEAWKTAKLLFELTARFTNTTHAHEQGKNQSST